MMPYKFTHVSKRAADFEFRSIRSASLAISGGTAALNGAIPLSVSSDFLACGIFPATAYASQSRKSALLVKFRCNYNSCTLTEP